MTARIDLPRAFQIRSKLLTTIYKRESPIFLSPSPEVRTFLEKTSLSNESYGEGRRA